MVVWKSREKSTTRRVQSLRVGFGLSVLLERARDQLQDQADDDVPVDLGEKRKPVDVCQKGGDKIHLSAPFISTYIKKYTLKISESQ